MCAKTIMAFILFSIFSSFSSLFCSNTESQLLFSLTSEGKIRMGVINTSKRSLHFEVVDNNSTVMYETSVKAGSNYFKLIDFSKLADGNYEVHLNGLTNDLKRKFAIVKGRISIVVNKNEEDNLEKPNFTLISNDAIVIEYNNSAGLIVRMHIEKNSEEIYSDENSSGHKFIKKYSLKNLPKGKYEIKLFVGDKTFTYPVEIKT